MSTATQENHGLSKHSHGYGAPIQIRSARPKSVNSADFEPIQNTDEQWRYIDASRLGSFASVALESYAGTITADCTSGIRAAFVAGSKANKGVAGSPEDLISAKAWERTSEVYEVRIAATGQQETARIQLTGIQTVPTALHTTVHAETNSNSLVIIEHSGRANLSDNLEIVVGDNAQAILVSIQNWDDESVHIASHFAKLGRNASLKHIVVTLGGSVVRISSQSSFDDEGAEVEMLGAYFANSNQYFENRLFVDHSAPNCKSRVTYKGALQGAKAHTVWVGDVLIRKSAEGTDTYELNRNLILTDGARADSVPNLEIETGQIAGAGHASASGRFDDEHLFYLQARGIPEIEARRLVVRGFLNEVIQQIKFDEVQETLREIIESKLNVGVA